MRSTLARLNKNGYSSAAAFRRERKTLLNIPFRASPDEPDDPERARASREFARDALRLLPHPKSRAAAPPAPDDANTNRIRECRRAQGRLRPDDSIARSDLARRQRLCGV